MSVAWLVLQLVEVATLVLVFLLLLVKLVPSLMQHSVADLNLVEVVPYVL